MVCKLFDAAQNRWQAVNHSTFVGPVHTEVVSHNGKLLEWPVDITPAGNGESTETEVA